MVKNEVSTSKIVHTNDGKCARCGDAKAPAAAASTRLRLCGRLGFGGSRLRGRGCARRRGVMNAQFAHQAREQCGSVAQPSTARAFATLAGLGATAFAAGAFFAAAFAGVAFLAGVFAMAARAGVGSATLAFAPAGAARAARGAPGERKSDANGVGRRAGWRRRPQRHDDSTSAASSRLATRSALRDPRRGAQYVQEVRINACAAPRRVAAYAGSASSLPQRGLQAAPEAYAPDAIRAGLPSTKQLLGKTWSSRPCSAASEARSHAAAFCSACICPRPPPAAFARQRHYVGSAQPLCCSLLGAQATRLVATLLAQ